MICMIYKSPLRTVVFGRMPLQSLVAESGSAIFDLSSPPTSSIPASTKYISVRFMYRPPPPIVITKFADRSGSREQISD
ncbi:hypothetical protein TIFTF001_009304 [Ficus carica]|uniref:Uncharacterized protein n=1 Tax=Ficus carica TaxID=3494 RepID=A0AA88D3H6_FICCA|nr:hypothetical protein TIFTF001_009304 [Ficus carica]